MPRYYFNIMDGRPVVDRHGIELPDANVVVTDEHGAEVLTVTLPKSAAERRGT